MWLLGKWEASSKNNALHYLVRCGSSASKCIIFYLLTGMFLIAFINSWCHRMSWKLQSQYITELFLVTVWHRLLWKQLLLCVLANKKWYSYWDFGFVGNKMAFTLGNVTKIESHFITYKSNENTSYLNTKKKQLP